jgi:SAM-dependent methyltransferase
MNQNELNEHRVYLGDERKIAAYRAALEEVVGADDVVLDLGAGTGLLGLLACEAGAQRVVAVEQGDIIEVAREIAKASGFGERITHVRAYSTEVALDRKVDVAVCDQIGGLVHDAGVLTHFADVKKRLLAPGGTLVPASFEVFMAPVSFDEGREAVDFWKTTPGGFETRAAHRVASNTEWRYSMSGERLQRLADPASIASFAADHIDAINGSAEFSVTANGRLDGIAGWFVAQLSPSVTLTNDPWSPDRFRRWWNFYPLDEAIDVQEGHRIKLDLRMSPLQQLISWRVEVTSDEGGVRQFSQSTFLSGATDQITSRGRPIERTHRIDQMIQVLGLIDGSRTPRAITDALSGEVGGLFTTNAQLESLVASVARFVDAAPRTLGSVPQIAGDDVSDGGKVSEPGRVSER